MRAITFLGRWLLFYCHDLKAVGRHSPAFLWFFFQVFRDQTSDYLEMVRRSERHMAKFVDSSDAHMVFLLPHWQLANSLLLLYPDG